MLTLYASVADNSGLVKAPNPYGAKIIRSYTEKGWAISVFLFFHYIFIDSDRSTVFSHIFFLAVLLFDLALETARRNRFSFNVSGMAVSETLLEAELHLYISKNEGPLPREVSIPYAILMNFYRLDITS